MTALLVMLVLTLFVVTPLASSAIIGSEITLCFVAVLTITGVAAVSGQRAVLVIVMCLAVSGIALDWLAHFGHQTSLRGLATSEALFGQLYPAVMIARIISIEILDRRRRDSAA